MLFCHILVNLGTSQRITGYLLMFNKVFIGIDFFKNGAHLALIKHTPSPQIVFLKTFIDSDKKQLYNKILFLLKKYPEALISTAPLEKDILTRSLNIQALSLSEIEDSLPFQAEPYLPFPMEDGLFDFQLFHKKDTNSYITLFAAEKSSIQRQIDILQKNGILCENISPKSVAISAANYFITDQKRLVLNFYIGLENSSLILSKAGIVVKNLNININTSQISDKEGFINFLLELSKNLAALRQQTSVPAQIEFIICGNCDSIASKITIINATLDLKTTVANLEGVHDVHSYYISLGLALNASRSNPCKKVNFAKEPLLQKFPWLRLRNFLTKYTLLTLLFSTSIFALGQATLWQKTISLKQRYLNLTKRVGYDMNSFKNEKIVPKNIEKATTLEILVELDRLEKKLNENGKLFELLPSVPRVSDYLAWLTSHPAIYQKEQERALISIESTSYRLVKFPSISKRKDIYQAKVDITFKASSSRAARELHQQLLDNKGFIDQKKGLKWTSSNRLYKTSFFLKNKSVRSI